MNKNHVRALILLGFVLTLGAGVVAGLLGARLPVGDARTTAVGGHGALADELHLSAEQRGQMRGIWETVQSTGQDCLRDARKLQQQRDDGVVKLLTPAQKQAYDALQRQYSDQCAALIARRESAFQKAVTQTKKILNASQRVKYQQILKTRLGRETGRDSTGGIPTEIRLDRGEYFPSSTRFSVDPADTFAHTA